MEYTRIVAVTGMPGLYEVLSSKSDGAIVRSLEDQSTRFVSSRVHNLSHLESIEVYTIRENVTLADVFTAMRDNKAKLPDVKDNNALKNYFETVFPDIDFDRVYASDMKKMVKWFEVLDENKIDFTAKPEEQEEAETAEVSTAEEPKKKAPKPAAEAEAKPKTAAKSETKTASKSESKSKPAAKTATKKAAKKSSPAKGAAKKTAAKKKSK